MCNLSWTPPLLEKDYSKNNPVTILKLLIVLEEEEEYAKEPRTRQ